MRAACSAYKLPLMYLFTVAVFEEKQKLCFKYSNCNIFENLSSVKYVVF